MPTPPTPAELVALAKDETFIARVALALAAAAFELLTPPDPAPTGAAIEARRKQLEAVRRLGTPDQVRTLAVSSMALVIGSPAVLAAGSGVSDQDLAAVVATIAGALTEYVALGGTP